MNDAHQDAVDRIIADDRNRLKVAINVLYDNPETAFTAREIVDEYFVDEYLLETEFVEDDATADRKNRYQQTLERQLDELTARTEEFKRSEKAAGLFDTKYQYNPTATADTDLNLE